MSWEETIFPDIDKSNWCPVLCPLCKGQCGGIKDHLEETTGTDLHGCENQHVWHDGETDPSKIRDDSLYFKQFILGIEVFDKTERLIYKYRLDMLTKEEFIKQYLEMTAANTTKSMLIHPSVPRRERPYPIEEPIRKMRF